MTKPEILHFNVFADPYTPDPRPIFNGVPSSVRPLYKSPDERVIVTSRKYPQGADYQLGPDVPHDEVFYLVDGSVRCTPEGGAPIVFEKGEVIYYPAGVAARWEYSPSSQHLAVFWGSADRVDGAAAELTPQSPPASAIACAAASSPARIAPSM